jgi:chorismate--pyruvate lyase
MKSRLFQTEPKWILPNLVRKNLPNDLQSWLFESESLTQRLRNQFENIRVQVLFQKKQSPFLTEWQILSLPKHRYCLIREVILLSNQTPLILARTIIPEKTLEISHGNLARLGSRPLGEILFSAPSLERKPCGIARIEPNLWATNFEMKTPLWGRRTKYSICQQPMLVSEFFLPNLFL